VWSADPWTRCSAWASVLARRLLGALDLWTGTATVGAGRTLTAGEAGGGVCPLVGLGQFAGSDGMWDWRGREGVYDEAYNHDSAVSDKSV